MFNDHILIGKITLFFVKILPGYIKRISKIMKTVLIFGGSGFIGKNIVHRVAKKGYKIIIPHQQPVNDSDMPETDWEYHLQKFLVDHAEAGWFGHARAVLHGKPSLPAQPRSLDVPDKCLA